MLRIVQKWKWKDKKGRQHLAVKFDNGETYEIAHKKHNVIVKRLIEG